MHPIGGWCWGNKQSGVQRDVLLSWEQKTQCASKKASMQNTVVVLWAYKLGAKMGNYFIANDRFILICSGWSYQTVSGRKGSCWKIQQEMQGRGGCEYDLCFSMYGSRKYIIYPSY